MRPLHRRLIAIAALPMISTMVLADTLGTADAGPPQRAEGVLLVTHSVHRIVPVQSWKTRRDARIVKQDLDYSCVTVRATPFPGGAEGFRGRRRA